MTRRNEVRFREFLNTIDGGGTAYVTFKVHYTSRGIRATFSIKDCQHEIWLDFNVSKSGDATNELAKLETLKTAITEFEQAYLAALKKHNALVERRKAKKKNAKTS